MENRLLDEALDTCLELLDRYPDDKNIHSWAGKLYKLKGMEEEADREFIKAGVK